MRFAYVCADVEIPLFGSEGCSIHIQEVVHALTQAGHEVSLFCASTGRAGSIAGVPIYSFAEDAYARHTLGLLEQEPLVQQQKLLRDLNSLLFNWWLREKFAAVFRGRQPDAIYERYSLFGDGGLQVSRELGIPLIVEVNAPLRTEQLGYDAFTLTHTAERLERDILGGADAVIAVSDRLREWMVKDGIRSTGVEVIPNGISERGFVPARSGDRVRQRFDLVGKKVIGYIGSFQAWHDVSGLVAALKELLAENADARLLLVGLGGTQWEIREQVRRSGLSAAVVFAGHVAFDEVGEYLAAMDVPVVPYEWQSNFYFSPIKLFECMASGRPTVAASVGQIREIVAHGETGWLYQPGDRAGMLAGIRALLSDAELARRIGAAARAQILSRHTWRHVGGRIADLAAELAAGPKSRLVRGVACES